MSFISLRVEGLKLSPAQFVRTIPTAAIEKMPGLGRENEGGLGCEPSDRRNGWDDGLTTRITV